MTAFYLVVRAFRVVDLFSLEIPYLIELFPGLDSREGLWLLLLIIPSVLDLVRLAPICWLVVLRKEYALYVVPGGYTTSDSLRATDTRKRKSIEQVREEMGLVPLSTLLIFINCRDNLGPLAYHKLLMGPDLIKVTVIAGDSQTFMSSYLRLCLYSYRYIFSLLMFTSPPQSIRLADVLLTRDWMNLAIWTMLYLLTGVLHPTFDSFICTGHITWMLIALILAQSVSACL